MWLTREAILDVYSQTSWQHLALDERERSAGVHNLPLLLSQPGSIWAAQGLAEPKDYANALRSSSGHGQPNRGAVNMTGIDKIFLPLFIVPDQNLRVLF